MEGQAVGAILGQMGHSHAGRSLARLEICDTPVPPRGVQAAMLKLLRLLLKRVRDNAAVISAVASCVAAVGAILLGTINYFGISAVRREALDQSSPFSLKRDVQKSILEIRASSRVFDLVERLHPGHEAVKESRARYWEEMRSASNLYPPLDSPQTSIRHSAVKNGMWAVRAASCGEQTPCPTYAMLPGEVIATGRDERGLHTVRISHADGYVSEYEHLVSLVPRLAAHVRVDRAEMLGSVTLASDKVCLRIGLKDRDGRYIDPRIYLPPMSESPPDRR